MPAGMVKSFGAEKGYGFITPENGGKPAQTVTLHRHTTATGTAGASAVPRLFC